MKSHLIHSRIIVLFCLQAFVLGAAMAQQEPGETTTAADTPSTIYTITDLGKFSPSALNDKGQVVGTVNGTGRSHAVLWDNGKLTDLATLPGYPLSGAGGINNKGQIVGGVLNDDRSADRAVLWENGQVTELGGSDGLGNGASGINDSSQVVGSIAVDENGATSAVLWENGSMRFLQGLGGSRGAGGDINNKGEAVGVSRTADGSQHATLWRDGNVVDLQSLTGYVASYGDAINDNEQVVGELATEDSRISHAFVWQDGKMVDLGTISGPACITPVWACESFASGNNDQGQVVGGSDTNAARRHAFLWQNGRMTDLNELLPPGSGWELNSAADINNVGQIVGIGLVNGKEVDAFLLTPQKTANATLELSRSSFSFGAYKATIESEPGVIWVHNTGPEAVAFAGIQFDGGAVQDFAVTKSTCGSSLAPDATCSVTFRFKPTLIGDRTSVLTFNDNARNSPQTVTVSGVGADYRGLQFSRSSWQFPTRRVGKTSGDYVIYIYNPSQPAAQFTSIQFSGGDAEDFAITRNTCGSSLEPYQTCAVAFHFAPTANGERRSLLIFQADLPKIEHLVSVSGFGSAPTLNFSRTSWQFPTRAIGETSGSYVTYVYNPSAQPVHFTSIQLAGGDVQDFAITGNTCGGALAPYTTCGVAFHFAPSAVGARTTSLIFNDDADGHTQVVSVSGFGAGGE